MKYLTSLSLTFFCFCAFASISEAQTPGGRVAVINTDAFSDERSGITKYVNAMKTVNTEFAPAQKELETFAARLQTLEKEITALRGSGSSADDQAGERKVEEYEKLERDLKFKTEDARSRYERRIAAVTAPLNQLIGAALTEFAKKKGYALILDLARDKDGVIVTIGDEKVDITTDFIAFYNAKP